MFALLFFCLLNATAPEALPLRADVLGSWLKQFSFEANFESIQHTEDSLQYDYEDPQPEGVYFSYTLKRLGSNGDAKEYFESLEATILKTFSEQQSDVVLVSHTAPSYGDRSRYYQIENAGEVVGSLYILCDGKRVYSNTVMGAFLGSEDLVDFLRPLLSYRLPR